VTSSTFCTVCLDIMYYLVYCFFCNYLFSVAIVRCRWLWEFSRARLPRLWAAASRKSRQVTLDHIDPMCSIFLFSSHIGMHALILLPKPHTLGFKFSYLLVVLSHAVLRVIQVFSSFVMLSWLGSLWKYCGLPPIEVRDVCVRINVVVWATVEMVEMVNTVMACRARIC
jgi:hypothetical protein